MQNSPAGRGMLTVRYRAFIQGNGVLAAAWERFARSPWRGYPLPAGPVWAPIGAAPWPWVPRAPLGWLAYVGCSAAGAPAAPECGVVTFLRPNMVRFCCWAGAPAAAVWALGRHKNISSKEAGELRSKKLPIGLWR